ncbi:putative cyclase [Aspergillus indologenus CBS 114.80]|uniref:Putative cyclase n=1 Tax=Aspergillus indologenus CBS 114.80 TaxID=1450541 RepID=A0A2V5I1W9_9EURO|nr:putative cyclase [Aspergillus indologenus CBS 114.80]
MKSPQSVCRPVFDHLPLKPKNPKGSSWGLWGEDDQLGTLNLITEDVVRIAASEVTLGRVVNLNLPLNVPLKPMNPRRKPCAHTLIPKGHANDDELDFNTQRSSHWDGLRHFPYTDTKQFYNGVTQHEIETSDILGIQTIAAKPIVTRGVLLDWYTYALKNKLPHRPFTNQHIPLKELLVVAQEQKVTFRRGDVLLIRTGWTAAYTQLSHEEKEQLGGRDDRASCGVEATEEAIRWHWERGFAAVASDTVAYEAWPSPKPWGVCMHEVFLSGWGMPIGECWDLEELSETCKTLDRWTFLLTSQPLNLPGGVASPPNAMAIF